MTRRLGIAFDRTLAYGKGGFTYISAAMCRRISATFFGSFAS